MTDRYILNDQGKPVPEEDLHKWAMWFRSPARIVAQEQVGDSKVSTIFLAIDHNFFGQGPPILWETMVFGGKLNQEMDRCAGSREQAEAMHARMVERVRESTCQQVNKS